MVPLMYIGGTILFMNVLLYECCDLLRSYSV